MSENHYNREEMKKHTAEEAIQSSQGYKAHRLATKECETAGRVKATQITDENSIVIVKIMICT